MGEGVRGWRATELVELYLADSSLLNAEKKAETIPTPYLYTYI